MRTFRLIHRWLYRPATDDTTDVIRRQRAAYQQATFLVPMLYVVTLFVVMSWLTYWWQQWLDVPTATLLWPIAWLGWVDAHTGAYFIYALAIVGPILAMLMPQKRWTRLLAFVGLLEMAALASSFGKINHSLHAWTSVAFVFIFLPNGDWERRAASLRERQLFLTTFWGAQALICLFYSMSGLWKLYGAFQQLFAGEMSAFHPYALAYQIATRLMETNSQSMLGPAILAHPWVGWPLLWGAMYIETFALVAAFRPSLHRWWGIGLMLLHLGNVLLLSIPFLENMTLVSLILIFSPFRPAVIDLRAVVRDLPIVGLLLRAVPGRFAKAWQPRLQ